MRFVFFIVFANKYDGCTDILKPPLRSYISAVDKISIVGYPFNVKRKERKFVDLLST